MLEQEEVNEGGYRNIYTICLYDEEFQYFCAL